MSVDSESSLPRTELQGAVLIAQREEVINKGIRDSTVGISK
jgi:hypothetical protein